MVTSLAGQVSHWDTKTFKTSRHLYVGYQNIKTWNKDAQASLSAWSVMPNPNSTVEDFLWSFGREIGSSDRLRVEHTPCHCVIHDIQSCIKLRPRHTWPDSTSLSLKSSHIVIFNIESHRYQALISNHVVVFNILSVTSNHIVIVTLLSLILNHNVIFNIDLHHYL